MRQETHYISLHLVPIPSDKPLIIGSCWFFLDDMYMLCE
jgi:hypothetical protein